MRTGRLFDIGDTLARRQKSPDEFECVNAKRCHSPGPEKTVGRSSPGLVNRLEPLENPEQIMKHFFIAAGLFLLLAPGVSARQHSVPKQPILARITVYWASGGGGSDRWTRQHQSAIGARLRTGHCAVDPRRIPYGSKVTLPDGPLLAVDTGSAVVSRKAARRSGRTALERNAIVIDRFFETKRQALNWASRNPSFMLVQVSPPGSPPRPLPHPQKTSQILPPDSRQQQVRPVQEVVRSPQQDVRERQKSSRYAR